ncbi:serine proteinase stubble-like [Leguminivora glycinivorella]|uniref:serine proteinase stubble-like n=1 Tax=Leguminivora glycinivorella TaxID=1035111 RepID=UPI00200E6D72|nr:serine proteinase stubble-like [Leguminivora glycinivorella]
MFISFITQTCLLLAVLEVATTQSAQGSLTCKISDDIEGECILLQKCQRALDLLKLNDIKSLKNLTCGYDKLDAKVCCVTNKTDGVSITFNTTKDAATSRPEGGIANTVKVPPDPVATFASTTPVPTEAHPTKVYTTTTYIPSTTTHKQKKTNAPHHNNNDFIAPTLPTSSVAFSIRPPPTFTRPPALQPDEPPSKSETASETIPTFDNPLGVDPNIPSRFPLEDQDQNWHIDVSDVATEQMDRFPVLQRPVYLPSRNECGLLSTSDRIFGGQVAGLEELPWLARIKYLSNTKQEIYACHASLITDRFLITAAHCVVNQEIIDVRLGDWDSETEIDCIQDDCNDPPVDVKIDATFIHPSYHRQTLVGDIALLRLAHPVNFTEFIRPICLPTTEYIARIDYDLDSEYITGGWGKTEFETRSVVKRKISLMAVPMATCRAAIRRVSNQLAASAICAGGRKGEDSCAGDSGSSLVRLASENRRFNWFILELPASDPLGAARKEYPAFIRE